MTMEETINEFLKEAEAAGVDVSKLPQYKKLSDSEPLNILVEPPFSFFPTIYNKRKRNYDRKRSV